PPVLRALRYSVRARPCWRRRPPAVRDRRGDRVRRPAFFLFQSCSTNRSEPGKGVRRRGQCRTRPRAVVIHLAYQRFDGVEFQLVPDETDEGDVEHGAIEVALEVEHEHFEQRRAVIKSRTAAEARDRVEPHLVVSLAAADPHGIDAVLEAAILVEADIGGGVAEIAAALLAMDHLAA